MTLHTHGFNGKFVGRLKKHHMLYPEMMKTFGLFLLEYGTRFWAWPFDRLKGPMQQGCIKVHTPPPSKCGGPTCTLCCSFPFTTVSQRVTSFWEDSYTVPKWTRNLQMHTNEIEKQMAHFNCTSPIIKWFSEILKCFLQMMRASFTILTCLPWSFASCVVETEFRFLRTLYASLPWFCVQLDFYAYYTQKFLLTWPLVLIFSWIQNQRCLWTKREVIESHTCTGTEVKLWHFDIWFRPLINFMSARQGDASIFQSG